MIALAAAVAGCLLVQPGVDQLVDALPVLSPKIAAPLYLSVSAGDLACIIVAKNPKNAYELAGHLLIAGIALKELGVKGESFVVSGYPRGSNKWLR